jgi:hypothetical protein
MMPSASAAYQYDSNGNGPSNRRRAATLSPRVGLSYLDESREVFPDHDTMPKLPSFASPSAHGHHFPMRSRSSYGNDRYSNGPAYRLGSSPMDFNRAMEFNRPRTSSATSLPPISHTSEEFSVDPASFRRTPTGLALRDTAPSPSVTGLADAFQDPSSFVRPLLVWAALICAPEVPSRRRASVCRANPDLVRIATWGLRL